MLLQKIYSLDTVNSVGVAIDIFDNNFVRINNELSNLCEDATSSFQGKSHKMTKLLLIQSTVAVCVFMAVCFACFLAENRPVTEEI